MESVIPNMEKAEENYKVPNLEKGIAVLEYLSLHTQGETLQDIKSALDISQTTAYRILNTLVRLDYLIYNEDTKRYKLSRKLLTLGFRSLNEHNLLETVLPRLRDLRDQVKETACFGVLGDRKGIFIEQAQGHHTFRFILSPGKPFDLHCSAPGKAIHGFICRIQSGTDICLIWNLHATTPGLLLHVTLIWRNLKRSGNWVMPWIMRKN